VYAILDLLEGYLVVLDIVVQLGGKLRVDGSILKVGGSILIGNRILVAREV
jgi:hypothetical protein